MRSTRRREVADYASTLIAGPPSSACPTIEAADRAGYRVAALGRDGDQKPTRSLRIGEEMPSPLRQLQRQFDVIPEARPIAKGVVAGWLASSCCRTEGASLQPHPPPWARLVGLICGIFISCIPGTDATAAI